MIGNQKKSNEIERNHRKSKEIDENQINSEEIKGNRKFKRKSKEIE